MNNDIEAGNTNRSKEYESLLLHELKAFRQWLESETSGDSPEQSKPSKRSRRNPTASAMEYDGSNEEPLDEDNKPTKKGHGKKQPTKRAPRKKGGGGKGSAEPSEAAVAAAVATAVNPGTTTTKESDLTATSTSVPSKTLLGRGPRF